MIAGISLMYFTYSNIDNTIIKHLPVNENKVTENYSIEGFNNSEDNVFFDISIGIKNVGRIEIELFDDDVPITCKNFRYLCSQQNNKLNYVDSIFHRIAPNYLVQGGDIINYDGTGGYSAYGQYFKDENFNLTHNQEGLVAMANCGKDKNNSQFFIITRRGGYENLNNKYVVFGIIIKGYDIIKKIESSPVNKQFRPIRECRIIDCGIIKNDEDIVIEDSETIKLTI